MNALPMSNAPLRKISPPRTGAAGWRRALVLCFALLLALFAARGALAWEALEEAVVLPASFYPAFPSTVVDENGNVIVLHDTLGAGQYEHSLVVRHYDAAGAAWRPARVLDERINAMSNSQVFGLAGLSGGDALAVWSRQRYDGNGNPVSEKDLVWSRYSTAGGQWSAPAVVVEQCDCSASLIAGGQGDAWLLVSRYAGPEGTFAQRYSSADGWGAADRIYDRSNGHFVPMLKANSRGDAILTWAGSTVFDWFQARFFSVASQTWTPIDLAGEMFAGFTQQQISDASFRYSLKDIAIDDEGNVAFLGSQLFDDGDGTYNFTHDSYWVRRHSRASGTFATVARFDVPGRSFNTTTTGQGRLASDARGNLLALVPETVAIPSGVTIGIRQYRFDAAAASWDAGRVVLPGEFRRLQQDLASLRLTTDRAGNGLAVWVLGVYGYDGGEVRGARFSVANGEWTVPGTIAARASGPVTSVLYDTLAVGVALAAASNGEAVSVWSGVKEGAADTSAIYAARHLSWLHPTLADPLPIRAPGLATARVRIRNPADVAQSITLRLIESEGVMYANDETSAGQWANDAAGVQKIVTFALGEFAAGEERTIDVPLHVSVIPAEATPDTPASASVLFEAETADGTRVQSRLDLSTLHSDAGQGADFDRLLGTPVADAGTNADSGSLSTPGALGPSLARKAAQTSTDLPLGASSDTPPSLSGDQWTWWIYQTYPKWTAAEKKLYAMLLRFGWKPRDAYLVIYLRALVCSRPGKIGPVSWVELRKAAFKFYYHLQKAKWTRSPDALYDMVKDVMGELDTVNAMFMFNIMELNENYTASLIYAMQDTFAAYVNSDVTFQQEMYYYLTERRSLRATPFGRLVEADLDYALGHGYYYGKLHNTLLRNVTIRRNGGGTRTLASAIEELLGNQANIAWEHGYLTRRPWVRVAIHSPLMPLITDAQGRRAGIDPATGELRDEIPGMVIEPGHPWVIGLPAESGTLDIRYATAYPYAFGVDVQGLAEGAVTSSLSFSGTAGQGEQRRQTLNVTAWQGYVGVSQGGSIVVGEELTIEKTGDGSIDSSPAGTACGSTCNAQFDAGGSVTLTATPAPGKRFAGWGGACTGTASACTLTMDAGKRVTATFDNGPASQSIVFGAIPNVRVGGSGTLVATASSGLPVAFGSLAPTTCGVTGSTVTGLAAGMCTVAATQAGNSDFNPAPQATLSFAIAPAPVPPGAPTITSIGAGSGQATLYFAAPASSGSSPIAAYTATCTANGQATRSATGSASPLVVRGLTGGVHYTCSVSATNGEGSSGASAAMAVTPAPARNGLLPVLMLLLD